MKTSDDGSGEPTPLTLALPIWIMLAVLAIIGLTSAVFFGWPLLDYAIQYWRN